MTYELQQEAIRVFDYNPETGLLTRKITLSSRAQAGAICGCVNTAGYKVVRFNNKLDYVHRIAALIMTGTLPDVVDHLNFNKQDNRWINLKPTTHTANSHRKQKQGTGVYFAARDQRWIAELTVQGKRLVVGSSKDRAVAEMLYSNAKAAHLALLS